MQSRCRRRARVRIGVGENRCNSTMTVRHRVGAPAARLAALSVWRLPTRISNLRLRAHPHPMSAACAGDRGWRSATRLGAMVFPHRCLPTGQFSL